MAQGNQIDASAIIINSTQLAASAAAESETQEARPSFSAAPATQTPSNASTQSEHNSVGKRNDLVGRSVSSVEKELILDTLDYCLGNRTQAANILGISIRTLRNKLKQYSEENENAG